MYKAVPEIPCAQHGEWGFSWPWCCCVTAEGASAIPQERGRVLGVTESRFQYAFIRALLQQGDRRLSLMQRITHYSINAERSLWKRGLFLFAIWWRFWSYNVWGKKLYLVVTRSPWELVTTMGRGGLHGEFSPAVRPCRKIRERVPEDHCSLAF